MRGSAVFLLAVLLAGDSRAAPPARIPLLLDTDIGTDLDDAFALALVLASPELELRAVTTVNGDAYTRARVVCRFLHAVGRGEVPVAAGRPAREPPDRTGQFPYGLQPGVPKIPERQSAVEILYDELKARPGAHTLLAIGPLTNVAELLARHPDCKPWIKRIVLMGGALRVGYSDKPPVEAEWNIRSDIPAARVVFASGIPLVVAPLDATTNLKLEEPFRRQIFAAGTAVGRQLQTLHALSENPTPVLYDPVAVALCFEERFCRMEELRFHVDDKGFTRQVEGKPNARVATTIRREEFLHWYVQRLAPGPSKR
jgi:inosine-uridine nucleoside N-ribohydrolase